MSELNTTSEGLEEIFPHDLESSTPASAFITDVKHLASYNWIEASTPTIAVPGSPAKWSPPSGPRQVQRERGLVYVSQNDARHPESPLEPLFRALYIEQPTFDIHSVDVATDRNNIRKLLGFVDPSLSRDVALEFTISVEMAGQTAIFSREGLPPKRFPRETKQVALGMSSKKHIPPLKSKTPPDTTASSPTN